ncbi:EamA family transporter [Bordetella genomosp. 1]|uniref:EamA family transporter n=1 Tax=Bordetella genomosp. 1 TaxID=1395607 RepID=A0A261SE12_9BORD|nr:DMT family transporter [Bordetella genomosp. 1]MDQ8033521.1 DMT family transporter [Bordetella sp.]OZI35212.1 EamA family transporter [Bordetella genomosp. 1]
MRTLSPSFSAPGADRAGLWQMAAAMSISGTIGLFVIESGQSPWNVVWLRCVFGALGLALYGWRAGLLRQTGFTRRTLLLALAAGAALVLNWVLLFSAYRHASISLATAVYNVQPFLLIGLGALVLGERPGLARVAWSVLAFAGLLLVLPWHGDPVARHELLLGLGLGLGAALLYSFTALIVKQLRAIRPQVLALVQVTLGAVLLLPMVDFGALPAAPGPWGWLVALGLVHTTLMYILMYSAIQKLPTTSVAALSFIYPAVAILVDFAAFGQRLDAQQWLGVAAIFVAVAGVSLAPARRLVPSAPTAAPQRPAA